MTNQPDVPSSTPAPAELHIADTTLQLPVKEATVGEGPTSALSSGLGG